MRKLRSGVQRVYNKILLRAEIEKLFMVLFDNVFRPTPFQKSLIRGRRENEF